jgi:predicted TIM-barrel fold metal-dependent hydrolase
MVSCDNHANEPLDFLSARVEAKYKDRLPHIRTDPDGTQWLVSEGLPPQPVKVPTARRDLLPTPEAFENFEVMATYTDKMEDEDVLRQAAGRSLEERIRDRESQGADAELIFPQKGVLCFATPDVDFMGAMCRAWNRWAKDYFSADFDRSLPMALIAPADVEAAVREVRWAADNGFHGVLLPNRPVFNRRDQPRCELEYNDKSLEPLWAALAETGLPITFHVATGVDPRAVGGRGKALTQAVCHSSTTTMEPIVQLVSSGVFEQFPTLRAVTVESGVGWIPWCLNQMDHYARAHHMWVRPVLPELPSFYFRRNCAATFIEEPEILPLLLELGLEDNILWSSDYPHHEGVYPYSRASLERQLGPFTDLQRQKALGLNAARIFNIKAR